MATREVLDPQDEIARLLAILIRLQTENQAEAILELKKAGFGVARIAELLGTAAATANVAIQRSKKAKKPGVKKQKGRSSDQRP